MPSLATSGSSLLCEQVSLHEVIDGLDDLELQVVLVWNRSLQMLFQLSDFRLINIDELVKSALCISCLRLFYGSLKESLDISEELVEVDQSYKFNPDLLVRPGLLELSN